MSEALLCDLDALADMIADKLLQKMEAPISRSQELYTISQLAERYSLSPDSIRRRIKDGQFGEPVLMGKRGLRVTAEMCIRDRGFPVQKPVSSSCRWPAYRLPVLSRGIAPVAEARSAPGVRLGR